MTNKNKSDSPADTTALKTDTAENITYRLAFSDEIFLKREELRAVRLQLEWLKADIVMEEQGIDSTVVIFGGARFAEKNDKLNTLDEGSERDNSLKQHENYYRDARLLSQKITQYSMNKGGKDFVVVTGGGPGVMEAANRGAVDVGGRSIGLNIVLPFEQKPNPFVTPELCFQFNYFAIRKMHFLKRAKGLVVFPGGFGTLDELFEVLTLVQTKKIEPVPILLVGKDYWNRLIDFKFLAEQGAIEKEDLDLFKLVEKAEEAYAHLIDFWL